MKACQFKEDLSVDYDQLEKFIDFQIDNGTDSIIICGTTGEASTMSHDEQIEVIGACVSHVNKRVPVIAGAGANCTDEALSLGKRAVMQLSDLNVQRFDHLLSSHLHHQTCSGAICAAYQNVQHLNSSNTL